MDEQIIYNLLGYFANAITVGLLGVVTWVIKKISELDSKLQHHELNIVTKYVSQDSFDRFRDDFTVKMDRLEDKLEERIIRIDTKIDTILTKVDK